jgi:ketosteroid isomerase-like protein
MSVALIAFLLLASSASPAPSPDEAAVVRAVKEYHAAFEAGDPARVLAVLGPTYFIGDEKSAGGGDRMSAHFFKVGDTLRDWPKNFLASSGPYRDSTEVVNVSIRGDSAVVLAKETGSNKFRSWQNEETAWMLGRTDGRWRIVGQIIRDIQLPK